MSRKPTTDPRQGNAGNLGEWLSKPKNRAKMYRADREAAAELAAMREAEEAEQRATLKPSETSTDSE